MRNCPSCGASVRQEQKFCGKCGAKLALVSPEFAQLADSLRTRIERNPSDSGLHVELGDIYRQSDLPQEAISEYEIAVSLDASRSDARVKLGDIHVSLGELPKAESSYREALAVDPKSVEAKIGLFNVCCHLVGKSDEAIRLGKEIVQEQPENAEVHAQLKGIFAAKGMKDDLLRELGTLARLKPTELSTLKELARAYQERGMNDESAGCWRRVLDLVAGDAEARFELGVFSYQRGDFAAAIEFLRGITEGEQSSPGTANLARSFLGLAYADSGDLESARAIIKAEAQSPEGLPPREKEVAAAFYHKAGELAHRKGHFREAVRWYRRAADFAPENATYSEQLAVERAGSTKRMLKWGGVVVSVALLASVAWVLTHGKIEIELGTPLAANVVPDKVYVDGEELYKRGGRQTLGPETRTVDGKETSMVTYVSGTLLFGTHTVVVDEPGFEKWQETSKVGLGRTARLSARLEPIYGALRVSSDPGGRLYVDDRLAGNTPFYSQEILAVPHWLRLQSEGRKTWMSQVDVARGRLCDLGVVRLKGLNGYWRGSIQEPEWKDRWHSVRMDIWQEGARLRITYREGGTYEGQESRGELEGEQSDVPGPDGVVFSRFTARGGVTYSDKHDYWMTWTPEQVTLQGELSEDWDSFKGIYFMDRDQSNKRMFRLDRQVDENSAPGDILATGRATGIPGESDRTARERLQFTNIAPRARVTASSSFSADYAAVNVCDGVVGVQDRGEWASKGESVGAWIELRWPRSYEIDEVVICDRDNWNDHAEEVEMRFSDGSTLLVTGISNDGDEKRVELVPRKMTDMIRFTVTGGAARNMGFSEIQVYGR